MAHQRIPSFFRTAKNQSFHYEPRYYDPVKEDLQNREKEIRETLNMEHEKSQTKGIGTNIRGSFRGNSSRSSVGNNAGLIRMLLITVMGGGLLGYWYIGNDVLYFLLAIPLIYFLLKFLKVF